MSALEDFDDIDGPIAPSLAVWATLSEAERKRVMAALPHVVVHDFMAEGDIHAGIVIDLADAIRNHYGGDGPGSRRCYIGRSVMVHYPETRAFAPDLFVVFDVDDHPRSRFVVAHEGRGLDLALEVLVEGDARKDYQRNVALYARLGITEYFVIDQHRRAVTGYRLDPGQASYRPILGQFGRLYSHVLDLWLGTLDGEFRVFSREAVLPTTRELRDRFRREAALALDSAKAAQERADAEAERAQAEAGRAQAEAERAAVFEAELRRVREELAALQAKGSIPKSD